MDSRETTLSTLLIEAKTRQVFLFLRESEVETDKRPLEETFQGRRKWRCETAIEVSVRKNLCCSQSSKYFLLCNWAGKKEEENVGNAPKTKQRNQKYFSSFPLKLVELEEGFDTSSSNLYPSLVFRVSAVWAFGLGWMQLSWVFVPV